MRHSRSERDVLAGLGERPVAVGHAVPARGHDRRRDADAEHDVVVGVERLERGAGHGHDHRRAQLQGQHAGAEAERRGRGAGRGQQRERLRAGGLGGPVRAVAELLGELRRLDGGRRSEAHQAGEGDPGALHAHGGRPYTAVRAAQKLPERSRR